MIPYAYYLVISLDHMGERERKKRKIKLENERKEKNNTVREAKKRNKKDLI